MFGSYFMVLLLVQVILHTYIDSLRDDGDRKVNHHGVARTVNSKYGLFNTIKYSDTILGLCSISIIQNNYILGDPVVARNNGSG